MSEGGFSGALNSHQGDFSATRVAAPKHRQPEGDSDAGAAQNLLEKNQLQNISQTNKLANHQVNFQEAKLYLIFEFLTMDLKKYMDGAVSRYDLNLLCIFQGNILHKTAFVQAGPHGRHLDQELHLSALPGEHQ